MKWARCLCEQVNAYSEDEQAKAKVVREIVGGEVYEYVPLGKYTVSAEGVCDGRPTSKYPRVEVRHIIDSPAHGLDG